MHKVAPGHCQDSSTYVYGHTHTHIQSNLYKNTCSCSCSITFFWLLLPLFFVASKANILFVCLCLSFALSLFHSVSVYFDCFFPFSFSFWFPLSIPLPHIQWYSASTRWLNVLLISFVWLKLYSTLPQFSLYPAHSGLHVVKARGLTRDWWDSFWHKWVFFFVNVCVCMCVFAMPASNSWNNVNFKWLSSLNLQIDFFFASSGIILNDLHFNFS